MPAGAAVIMPLSSTETGACSIGSSRSQAARARSNSDNTQPAANIGQINCPKYMLKLVSAPIVSCDCHTR